MDTILFYLPQTGSFLIGFFFVFFGIWNSYHWRPTVAYMQQKGIPLALPVLIIGIITETICGLLLMLGMYVKIAALLLIPFDIVAVLIFHPFWLMAGEIRRLNMLCFITNLTATLGALILLLNSIEPATNMVFY